MLLAPLSITLCFVSPTRGIVLLAENGVEDYCHHDQHHQEEDQTHDDLVRHHANQVCPNQLLRQEEMQRTPAPTASAGCRFPPHRPSFR